MIAEKNRIVVICVKCGTLAPYEPPCAVNPLGVWLWHQPCPRCGAEIWGAHDTIRDIATGRIREPARRQLY